MTTNETTRTLNPFVRAVLVIGLLYMFLLAITLLGGTFKELGKGHAEDLITHMNPIAALAVGILATVLVQSSSVTTSIIVGIAATTGSGDLESQISSFVPMIMGANIGTTITNTLAALGHVTRSIEFERAFAGAIIHDFFNVLTVIIVLPIELATGFLTKTSVWMLSKLHLGDGLEYKSPIKSAVKAGDQVVRDLVKGTGLDGIPYAVIMIAIAAILIFVCLVYITKNMKVLMATRLERAINNALDKSGVLGIFIGILVTVAVQSSSITTSILIPMFGAGLLTHQNGFPIMLGANIGTTVTALLAAVVKGPAGMALALVHLLFNITGILLFYPIPALRRIPVRLAQGLAAKTVQSKWWILLYLGGVFVALPLLAMLLFR